MLLIASSQGSLEKSKQSHSPSCWVQLAIQQAFPEGPTCARPWASWPWTHHASYFQVLSLFNMTGYPQGKLPYLRPRLSVCHNYFTARHPYLFWWMIKWKKCQMATGKEFPGGKVLWDLGKSTENVWWLHSPARPAGDEQTEERGRAFLAREDRPQGWEEQGRTERELDIYVYKHIYTLLLKTSLVFFLILLFSTHFCYATPPYSLISSLILHFF